MNTPEVTEQQINERAQQIIDANAARYGVDPNSFTSSQREDAKRTAAEQLQYESNPHVQALQASQEENRQLKAQLEALRSRGPVAPPSGKAPFNAAQVRGRLGASFYQMSQSQRIVAAGQDPTSVNVHELKKLFGRGADTAAALDYSRQAPSDYARKRELARLLDLDGR
jgi:hypothetical protein